MAVKNSHVAVDATRDQVVAGEGDGISALIKNKGPNAVYIGNDTVTAGAGGNGYEFAAADPPISADLGPGESIHAICNAAETAVLHVFLVGARETIT